MCLKMCTLLSMCVGKVCHVCEGGGVSEMVYVRMCVRVCVYVVGGECCHVCERVVMCVRVCVCLCVLESAIVCVCVSGGMSVWGVCLPICVVGSVVVCMREWLCERCACSGVRGVCKGVHVSVYLCVRECCVWEREVVCVGGGGVCV